MSIDVYHGFRNALFKLDVCWLIQRCPEGRQISDLCTPHFLDRIDDDELVIAKRVHFEELGDGEKRLVVTALFRRYGGGIRLINEIVCHPNDFRRVCKIVAVDPDDLFTDEKWAEWQEEDRKLRNKQEVEGSPWEESDMEWEVFLEGREL